MRHLNTYEHVYTVYVICNRKTYSISNIHRFTWDVIIHASMGFLQNGNINVCQAIDPPIHVYNPTLDHGCSLIYQWKTKEKGRSCFDLQGLNRNIACGGNPLPRTQAGSKAHHFHYGKIVLQKQRRHRIPPAVPSR